MQPDSVYAPKPWELLPQQREGLALLNILMTDPTKVRPPIPGIGRRPPRFGYRHRYPQIRDVINVDTTYPGARVDYSQSVSGYQGTGYPALGVM